MTKKEIELEELDAFGEFNTMIRLAFPRFAKEIDRCAFDVGQNYLPKCGHATCDCQTMTFEEFHAQRNLAFKMTNAQRQKGKVLRLVG